MHRRRRTASTARRASAAVFYAANIGVALLAAVVILIPGAPLLSIALNANVLATVLLPVSLVFMVMLANDRGLMGRWANKRSTNVIGDRGHRVRRRSAAPPTASTRSCRRSTSSADEHEPVTRPPIRRIREQDLQRQERFEDELIMHLERDQFVAETSRPVPRAALSARATRRPVGAARVRRASSA